MDVENEIRKYTDILWHYQLPAEEETFLYDLLEGRPSTGFHSDPDADYSLFLAYNAKKHGYQGYSEEQISTFEDILRTYKFQRLDKIPSMSKVFRALNENGIVPVLLKGAAFLCYYAPGLPRMMGDLDICIDPDHFDKAVSVLYGIGYKFLCDTGYHVAVQCEKLDIDVHRCMYKNRGDVGADIYDRLIECTFLGSKVYVPAPEDMLLHQLVNRGQDICQLLHMKRHYKWIVDCCSILKSFKERPDTISLMAKAGSLQNTYYATLTLSKLASLFPDKFEHPEIQLNDKEYLALLKLILDNIEYDRKNPAEETRGIRYAVCTVVRKWKTAKVAKAATRSDRSVLGTLIQMNCIDSLSNVLRKCRRLIADSRYGIRH